MYVSSRTCRAIVLVLSHFEALRALSAAESQILILKWLMMNLENLQQRGSSQGERSNCSVGKGEGLGEELEEKEEEEDGQKNEFGLPVAVIL